MSKSIDGGICSGIIQKKLTGESLYFEIHKLTKILNHNLNLEGFLWQLFKGP